jgi:hypothetical protein
MKSDAELLLAHIGTMQERMRAYLTPDSGITAEQFAGEIIELLDGPEWRELKAKVDAG